MSARRLFGWLFALLSTAMLGLAAGAVWMLAILIMQRTLPWLALPLGWLLALAIRRWVMPPGTGAAALAALTTLLAAAYVSVLTAAAQIAGSLGMGLIDTVHTAGAGMLLTIARLSLTAGTLGWFIAGAAVAAWFARRRGIRSPTAPTVPAP